LTDSIDTSGLRAELELSAASPRVKDVRALLGEYGPELEKRLPEMVSLKRFSAVLLNEVGRNPKLEECSGRSLIAAGLRCAELDLWPGPLGLIYLVPFRNKKTNTTDLVTIIGYRGHVELAYRTGLVKDVSAALVRKGDYFKFREGTRPFLDHEPDGPPAEREIVAAYAVARLKSGGAPFRVIYEPEWELARSRSNARNAGPWVTDTDAMILKTAYRRLEPKLPKTPLMQRAFGVDESPVREIDEDGDLAIEDAGDE